MRISDWSSDVCSSDLRCRDVVDAAAAPERVPGRGDRPVDQAPLGIAGLVVMTRHLPDDRLDHGKAVETVILVGLSPRIVDHREGVEREARSKRELDEAPALKLDRVLERAAIVDDHDFGTRTAQDRKSTRL